MNITIVGHVCIDQNMSEHTSYTSIGGPAVFIDMIIHLFPDTQTTIITPYGKDFMKQKLSASLYPDAPTTEKTLVYKNSIKNGRRTQRVENYTQATPVPLNGNVKTILSKTDILFIAPILPNFPPDYIAEIIHAVNPAATKILLPQGYFRTIGGGGYVFPREFKEYISIIPLTDIVIVSKDDGKHMGTLIKSWIRRSPKLLGIMTMADKGVTALTKKKKILVPAVPVPEKDIVDSVGSGDIWSAGFAYVYKKTQSVQKAGRFANALARKCLFYTSDTIQKNIDLSYERKRTHKSSHF